MRSAAAGVILATILEAGCSNSQPYELTLTLTPNETLRPNMLAAVHATAFAVGADMSTGDFLCLRLTSNEGMLTPPSCPSLLDGGGPKSDSCASARTAAVRLSSGFPPETFVFYRAGSGPDLIVGQLMQSFICDTSVDRAVSATALLSIDISIDDAGI